MPMSPQEAIVYSLERQRELVKPYVKIIDEALEERYNGGEISIDIYDGGYLSTAVEEYITNLYENVGWEVGFGVRQSNSYPDIVTSFVTLVPREG